MDRGIWDRARASLEHDFARMLVLTACCGVTALAAFVSQRTGMSQAAALALYAVAYVTGGWYASRDVVRDLRALEFDIDLLMIVVALGAAAIGAYAEGATLLFLFSLSNALERFANYRTERTIDSLLKAAPETTWIRKEDRWVEIPCREVKAGDLLLVKPGELFPVDGTVVEGTTSADESALTGESLPVPKEPGSAVTGGSVNLEGQAVVRATKPAEESGIRRIIDLINNAREQKAPAQRFTDTFTRYYTVFVLVTGVTILAALLLWSDRPFAQDFYFVMTLLVVASPCALVLSIPSAILVAIAAGARQGILFRGGIAVEKLAAVTHFVFDKTGTLTAGELEVTRIEPAEQIAESELLATAAAVAEFSTHPLSRAIVREHERRGHPKIHARGTRNIPGFGMAADVGDSAVFVGSRRLMEQQRINVPQPREDSGHAEVWVAASRLLGVIYLRDRIRPAAARVISWLKRRGYSVALISGDRNAVARTVASEVGIADVHADLKPDEKLEWIRRWQSEGRNVAMVGDGVNDAPSLTAADVGIGMGARGSDAALEQADVILMHDKIENVEAAVQLSRRARAVIRQNLVISLGALVLLVIAALGQRINLSLGVVGHEGSTVIVVLNGLRLLRK